MDVYGKALPQLFQGREVLLKEGDDWRAATWSRSVGACPQCVVQRWRFEQKFEHFYISLNKYIYKQTLLSRYLKTIETAV